MNNISIKNIFDDNYNFTKSLGVDFKKTEKYTLENINVNDITNNSSYVKLSDDFIINKIKYNENFENKKTTDLYESKYNDCLMKINNAIDLNITDIFFEVLDCHFGYKLYNSYKCLEFIQNKLRKKNFSTLILNKNTIFVSWKNSNFIK
jgi:hypothetical protein